MALAMMRWLRSATVVVLLLAATTPMAADSVPSSELAARVKAAFLFNFARFVVWPADKFAAPDSPIVACVVGAQPFRAALEDSVRGKRVGARALQTRAISQAVEARGCHLLFAPGPAAADLPLLLESVAGYGVLTVHEEDRTLAGGVVRFVEEDRKLRFEINTAAAERARLQLSAKLLDLARLVRE